MTLIKWNNQFPTLSNVFDNFLNNQTSDLLGRDFSTNIPAVNIKENTESFIVELAAPGLNKEDFKLHVEDNFLTISAEKKSENEQNEQSYTRKEFSFTSFKRSFTLPKTVDSDKIEASYTNGILNIHIPKKEEAKPKPVREISIG